MLYYCRHGNTQAVWHAQMTVWNLLKLHAHVDNYACMSECIYMIVFVKNDFKLIRFSYCPYIIIVGYILISN